MHVLMFCSEHDVAEVERIRHENATMAAEFEEMSRSNRSLMEQLDRIKISKYCVTIYQPITLRLL